MLASELIKRARSLADIPHSQFISNSDEMNSLWESWKDIYSKITDSSDDYFVSSTILDTSTATKLGEWEYEIDLPSDMWKIRFVDYKDNGRWINMYKFNTNNRNRQMASPQYRLRNGKLWVITSNFNGLPTEIRIDYYPPPVQPSVPQPSYQYCLSLPAYTRQTIASVSYFSVPNANSNATDYLLYVNNNKIYIESTTLRSTKLLYTGASAITNVQYYLGYIYFIMNGDIYRAVTDYSSPIVPTAITASGTITNFTVQNYLYYTDATQTYEANLDGTGATVTIVGIVSCVSFINTDLYYVKSSRLYKNNVATTISTSFICTDGTYIYYLDLNGALHKYLNTYDVILASNIATSSVSSNGFIATIDRTYNVNGLSTSEDYDFDYPINEANESMAYQSAIDFKRKQNGDISLLVARNTEIQARLISTLVRDAYQPERRCAEAFTQLGLF